MRKFAAFMLSAVLGAALVTPALAAEHSFGSPEPVALAIGGNQMTKGRGFLKNFTYLTQQDMDTLAASGSGESSYRLGLGDSFSELMTYSAFENHGTPVWSYRRVYGLDLTLLAQALGIDTAQTVSVSVSSADGMSRTLSDAFGVQTRRYTYDVTGSPVSEIGPILALFETKSQTKELGAGVLPTVPKLGADSVDRVNNVFGYGQTAPDEVTNCYWIKEVCRLRYGAEDVALTVSAGGKTQTTSLSGLAVNGVWQADFGTVRASGIPLTELLAALKINVAEDQCVQAVSAGGTELMIPYDALDGAFVAWYATDSGAAVKNATALRLYCGGKEELPDLVSLRVEVGPVSAVDSADTGVSIYPLLERGGQLFQMGLGLLFRIWMGQ